MKDPLLIVLVLLVGVMLCLLIFKGVIYPAMLLAILVLAAIWCVASFYISRKMLEKAKAKKVFFAERAKMVSEDGTESVPGMLMIDDEEVAFFKRKGYFGKVETLWSVPLSSAPVVSSTSSDGRKGVDVEWKGGSRSFLSKRLFEKRDEMAALLDRSNV